MDFNTLNRGDVLKFGHLDNLTGIVTNVEKDDDGVLYYFTIGLTPYTSISFEPTRISFSKIKSAISKVENVKDFSIFDISGYFGLSMNSDSIFKSRYDKHLAFNRSGSKMSVSRKTSLLTTAKELWENNWFIQHEGGWNLSKFKEKVPIYT